MDLIETNSNYIVINGNKSLYFDRLTGKCSVKDCELLFCLTVILNLKFNSCIVATRYRVSCQLNPGVAEVFYYFRKVKGDVFSSGLLFFGIYSLHFLIVKVGNLVEHSL